MGSDYLQPESILAHANQLRSFYEHEMEKEMIFDDLEKEIESMAAKFPSAVVIVFQGLDGSVHVKTRGLMAETMGLAEIAEAKLRLIALNSFNKPKEAEKIKPKKRKKKS